MKSKSIISGLVAFTLLVTQTTSFANERDLNLNDFVDDTPPVSIRTAPRISTQPSSARYRAPVTSRAGMMSGVEKSMIPGITCPLVENRPHADLLAAIENLNRHVTTTPNCKDNGDMAKMAQMAAGMKASGTALQEYWNNPNVLTENPAQMANFQRQLETIVTGISSFGETLSSNALLKTECGKSLTGKSSILLAFSDLASSLAPMALLGASINPSWSVALKVILGVVGVGSTAKIFTTIYEEGNLDMSLPENRMALLQNTCEFSRIAQRVRFLKLAQSGQINQVTEEIKMYKSRTDSLLKNNTSERVLDMIAFRNQVLSILDEAKANLEKDTNALAAAQNRVAMKDDNLVCMFAQDLVARAENQESFPGRPVATLNKLTQNQDEVSPDQSFLLKSETVLREKIKSQVSSTSEDSLSTCATNGRSYVTILANIIRQTDITVKSHRASLFQQLSQDTEFAQFQQEETKAFREVDTLAKIGSVLERLNKDNSVIDKSEMHQQVTALKRALFNSDKFFHSSPVMAWLKHSNTMYAEAIGRFNKEMSGLIVGAQSITKSGTRIPMPPKSDRITKEYQQALSQYLQDSRTATNLSNVTLKLAPAGSPQHKDICQRLENAWLEWASALDHLSAQDFFCKTVSSLMDQTVEQSIKDHCYGKTDFAGKIIKKSAIAAQQSQLVEIGAKSRAQLVSKKLNDLKCEMPDPAASMQ